MICIFMETMSMMLLEHTGGIYHPPKSRFFFCKITEIPRFFVRCSMLLSTTPTTRFIYFPMISLVYGSVYQLFSLPWMTAALVLGSARLSIFFPVPHWNNRKTSEKPFVFTVSLCHVLCFVLHKHWETPYERSKPPTVSLAQEGSKLWTRT